MTDLYPSPTRKPCKLHTGEPLTHNNTPFTWEEIKALPYIGRTVSKWRGRNIDLYQHPHYSDHVVSVGTTFDGQMEVAAVEDKEAWRTALEYISRGKVYTSE